MVQLAGNDIADETTEALERAARRRGESVDSVLRSLLGIDRTGVAAASHTLTAQFDGAWERIQALAGTEFTTRSGQMFTYAIEREYLLPSTSDVRIPVSQFRRAFAVGPVRGPSSFRGIFAPSIVWAVLNDARVRRAVAETASSSAAETAAAGLAEAVAPERSVKSVEGDGARMIDHTWPDDSGADIADLSAGPSAEMPIGVEQAPAPAVAAPFVPDERHAQTADRDARGFFKRIFGGRQTM